MFIKNIDKDHREDFKKIIVGLSKSEEFRYFMPILEKIGIAADLEKDYYGGNGSWEWWTFFSYELYKVAFKSEFPPEIGVPCVTCACLILGWLHESGDAVIAVHEKAFKKMVEKKKMPFVSVFEMVQKELLKQFVPSLKGIPQMNRN